MPLPAPRPAVYTDHASLIADMQLLLTDPTLCDATILVADAQPVALPSQILIPRSPYFAALLSPRWAPTPPAPLSKPDIALPVFHDLLEFLVTGAVNLSLSPLCIPHNVRLHALAHELLLPDLELTVLHHIATHLTLPTLPLYLRALLASPTPPSPQLQTLLSTFLADNISAFTTDLAAHDWQLMRLMWRMLVAVHAHTPFPPDLVSAAARAIMAFSTLDSGTILRIPQLVARESEEDRDAMLAFLCCAAPLTFAAVIAPADFYTDLQLLDKYRNDALQPLANDPLQASKRPRWRVLCESEHPYPCGGRLDRTVRRVLVPVEDDRMYDSLLTFDKRSSLGGGAELTFYTRDPALGTHPHTFIVGRSWQRELILPGTEFWYAFASPNDIHNKYEYLSRKWGWRFFAEPITPVIDGVD